nr:RNA-directed DNA polymerase, eukaryota [Tanacetum cinerariifolium]
MRSKRDIINELGEIDKNLDIGLISETIILRRLELKHKLLNINDMESKDYIQKSKVTWAIEGDENSKFFHGIINKKRSQLAIRGIFVDGSWCTEPGTIKKAFVNHFEARFKEPGLQRFKINFQFPKKLLQNQADDLERVDLIGSDLCEAVEYFFRNGSFPKGCNSSFIALIPKGGPLAPYLFILVMKSLHLSICHLVDNGLFSGIQLPGSVTISHLFYADDAMFIGEWSEENLKPSSTKGDVLEGGGVSLNVTLSDSSTLLVCLLRTIEKDKLQIFNLHVKANELKQSDKSLEDFWIALQGVWGEIDRTYPNLMKCQEEFEDGDTDTPEGQEGNQEPTDLNWKEGKTPQKGPTQNWLKTLAASTSTGKSLKEFDELMSTPIYFSSYILNGMKIEILTQEILLGPAFRLLKGTCSNYAELDYDFEECYKALSEKLDWENTEGDDYPFDLSKPLPLITHRNRQSVPVEFFINNDLKYLQGGILTMTYTTSTTKTKGRSV